jgi:uncharacterized protein YggL (DUF469 family)
MSPRRQRRRRGFAVALRLRPGLDDRQQLQLLTRFVVEAIEARRLLFGGGDSGGFVTRAGNTSTTEDDRQAVIAWLGACPDVEHAVVGEMEDA